MSPDKSEEFPITIRLESGEYLCFRTEQGLSDWELENGFVEVRPRDFFDEFTS